MRLMGLDPMVDRGTDPFRRSDNMLALAEQAGLGTRDLNRIEVIGARIEDVAVDYAAQRASGIPDRIGTRTCPGIRGGLSAN